MSARSFGAALLGLSLTLAAAANPLQALHEAALQQAEQRLAAIRDEGERRAAQESIVAALDSLGRSEQALARLDAFEAELPAARRNAAQRVRVLIALGRCADALPALDDELRERWAAQRKLMPGPDIPYLITGAESLLAGVYCETVRRQFDAAVLLLAAVIDPFDPSLIDYKQAWYASLRRLGAAAHPGLEREAQQHPSRPGVHGLSRAVASGSMSREQAQAALRGLRLNAAARQDAEAELLFMKALREEAGPVRDALAREMDALQPMGSAEWTVLRQLQAAR